MTGARAAQHEAEPVATYEVDLQGPLPTSLLTHSPAMSACSAPVQTLLFRTVQTVAELDELLDRVQATGLQLDAVHATELADGAAAPRGYEVWVGGELGENLLSYLGWSHELVAERQVARGDVSPRELNTFIAHCCASGLRVEQVRRLEPAQP
jgi:hypothetical protein